MNISEASEILRDADLNRQVGHPYLDSQALKAAFDYVKTSKHASYLLYYTLLLELQPYKDEVLKTTVYNVARSNDVYMLLYHSEALNGTAYREDVLKIALPKAAQSKDNAFAVLEFSELLKTHPQRDQLLSAAFQNCARGAHPEFVLKHIELLGNHPQREEIAHTAFRNAAISPACAFMLDPKYKLDTKPYRNEVYGLIATTKYSSLGMGTYFNDLHEEPNAIRFSYLNHLSASQKFNIITLGRSEVFTSTYNGVLNSLLLELNAKHQQLTDVLSPTQMQKMGVFMEAAASYNRLDDVLQVIPPASLPKIFNSMTKLAGTDRDLKYSNTLVSLMLEIKDHAALQHQLEVEIKNHYEHAANPVQKDRYGFIASAYGKNADHLSADMKPFFLGIANNPDYVLPQMDKLKRAQLMDKKGVCNQLMVFADDDDSLQSYNHFKNTYAQKAHWKIEEFGNYIRISSTDGAGVPVRIYANLPGHYNDGLTSINRAVAKVQGTENPAFQAFIGRGHSYHAPEYLPLITKDMHLVHLGSCGGFQNIADVIDSSPKAHVISTKETGSMYVNDPMIANFNESIRTTGAVDWKQQQALLAQFGTENKNGYILPHKNIPAVMQSAYNNSSERREKEMNALAKRLGITNSDQLAAYIQERSEFFFLCSDGKIDAKEMRTIIDAAKMLGKDITVTQTNGANDTITLTDQKWKVTYKVTLDPSIPSQTR